MPVVTPVKNRSGRQTIAGKGVIGSGGRGQNFGGGKAKKHHPPLRRHRKILRDTIQGVTKGDIRRLARRGGVKRISGGIYDEMRLAMKNYIKTIMKDVCAITEYSKRKTVTVTDIIFALRRQGRPIYGFDADSYQPSARQTTRGR